MNKVHWSHISTSSPTCAHPSVKPRCIALNIAMEDDIWSSEEPELAIKRGEGSLHLLAIGFLYLLKDQTDIYST